MKGVGMKKCACDYCRFQGDNGCPRADAEEEVMRLEKEIQRLEEKLDE